MRSAVTAAVDKLDVPLLSISIASIDIPESARPIVPENLDAIEASIRELGLLTPIAVMPRLARYELLFGGHRLAACTRLGHLKIPSRIFRLDEEASAIVTIAENLHRADLNPAQKLDAISRWDAYYRARHPEAHGPGVGGKARAAAFRTVGPDDGPEAPAPAARAIASATGMSPRTVSNDVTLAKHFSADELKIFGQRDITKTQMRSFDRIKDPAQRARCLSMIAGGLEFDRALATATAPATAVVTDVKAPDPGPARPAEDALKDMDWLDKFCGEVVAKIESPSMFKINALAWRKIRPGLAQIQKDLANLTKSVRGQSTPGPIFALVSNLAAVQHPSEWHPCGKCGGAGTVNNRGKCDICKGNGFMLKNGKSPK